jgi:hypothetical protein
MGVARFCGASPEAAGAGWQSPMTADYKGWVVPHPEPGAPWHLKLWARPGRQGVPTVCELPSEPCGPVQRGGAKKSSGPLTAPPRRA